MRVERRIALQATAVVLLGMYTLVVQPPAAQGSMRGDCWVCVSQDPKEEDCNEAEASEECWTWCETDWLQCHEDEDECGTDGWIVQCTVTR